MSVEKEFVMAAPAYSEEKECRMMVPIPLPSETMTRDWVAKFRSKGPGRFLEKEDVTKAFEKFVRDETWNHECAIGSAMIQKVREHGLKSVMKSPEIKPKYVKNVFAEKFAYIMSKCSSENLLILMQMECFMRKEMSKVIRARNWEVDQLSKQCEKLVIEDQEANMHPHKVSMLNEKLRQVHVTYSHQLAELEDQQKKRYRQAVDALYNRGSLPAELLDGIDLDDSPILAQDGSENGHYGINESFTIFIGAQLKSMHNVCLVTVDSLTRLCQTLEGDWTPFSRLEMATKLYGRSLTAVTLLVPRDPFYHYTSSSEFYKICEQSTELHFEPLREQLKEVASSIKKANNWRADKLDATPAPSSESTENAETQSSQPVVSSTALRADPTFAVGDIYITKHSNLHKMQLVFHLVTEDRLQSIEISSRHRCLNGLRNIIRLTASYGITSIHLPLLLIDRPDESTTIAWCVKRAEMVYKCVKGYLIEVCSGTNPDSLPHYNVHFILPSGLAPTIYTTITNMFPTIFYLVPSVSITL